MEHVHRLGAAHEHIPDAGDHIHVNVFFHTVFEKDVPVMAVDATKKDSFHSVQQFLIGQCLLDVHGDLDLELFLQPVFFHQTLQAFPHIVNHGCSFCRELGEIPAMSIIRPQS